MRCKYCDREYKIKVYYNRHVISCQLLHRSGKELRDFEECMADTPDIRGLYDIVLEMNAQIQQLQKKVGKLENEKRMTQKKVSIIDWLQTQQPPTDTWAKWGKGVMCTQEYLQYTFKTDITAGLFEILKDYCDGQPSSPIKAFDQKQNILYVYEDDKWSELSRVAFEKLIGRIHQSCTREFVKWQDIQEGRMSSDEFMNIFTENIHKLNRLSITQISKKIYPQMYGHLKVNIKSTIQLKIE